ncbi:hypothetical protein LR48_Vigan721s001300 [Vigna angularis]|uniref:Uncharacterized protein n=1 Tax=Phaseolus angularis TaxID=3914 RepID=A0A0L9TGC8_PHAAN|nr:hypothetical protein LR48_Vigan721s001300 [Vigna angularis]
MREKILAAKLVKEVKFRVARVAGEALVLQVLREIISKIHKGSLQENARTSNFDIKIGRSSKLLDQLVVGRNGLSVRLWYSKVQSLSVRQNSRRFNITFGFSVRLDSVEFSVVLGFNARQMAFGEECSACCLTFVQ